MTFPDGYAELIGRGKKHIVDGVEIEAYPLTVEEYLEYLSMRPDSTVEGEGDDRHVVYATKADEIKELNTIAYVHWATLSKQGRSIKDAINWKSNNPFDIWKSENPGFILMGNVGVFVNDVIIATVDPIQKKK